MNCWNVLEISPTDDKSEIRRAYAKLLKKYHPEDDPEGFIKVRQAYEEALKLSGSVGINSAPLQVSAMGESMSSNVLYDVKHEDTETSEETDEEIDEETDEDIDEESQQEKRIQYDENDIVFDESGTWETPSWLEKLLELYSDVFRRRDKVMWEQFFTELTLEESQHLYKNAPAFFNHHSHLPFEIWKYLEGELSLTESPDFIWREYIYFDYGITFEWLDRNIDCDYKEYMVLRGNAFNALHHQKFGDAVTFSNQAEKIYSGDPLLFRVRGTAYYNMADMEKAIDDFSRVLEKLPGDADALLYRGNAFLRCKNADFSAAYADFFEVLKVDNNNREASIGLIKYHNSQKNYWKVIRMRKKLYKIYLKDIELDICIEDAERVTKAVLAPLKVTIYILIAGISLMLVPVVGMGAFLVWFVALYVFNVIKSK